MTVLLSYEPLHLAPYLEKGSEFGEEGWLWGLPEAGPFSQAVVVAVSNDVTVAGQNLERKGGSGDCLGPDHFRKQLLWQCVMTSLSQLKILEFSALSGQFLCLLASLSQSKIVRAKCSQNVFFSFLTL